MSELTRKIALEEHSLAPEFKPYFETTTINISPEPFGRAMTRFRTLAIADWRSRMRRASTFPS